MRCGLEAIVVLYAALATGCSTEYSPPVQIRSTTADSPGVEADVSAPHELELLDLPYPNRTDPFNYSTYETSAVVDVTTSDDTEPARPQLRGYVDVDDVAAIFLFDGVLHLLGPGDSLGEMTIVSISPPNVEIQIHGAKSILTLRKDIGK